MARRRLNFDLPEVANEMVDIGYEENWKDKLYDLPSVKFKRNAPPLLGSINYLLQRDDVNEEDLANLIEEEGDDFEDIVTTPTTPMPANWGQQVRTRGIINPNPAANDWMTTPPVPTPTAGPPAWMATPPGPVGGAPWMATPPGPPPTNPGGAPPYLQNTPWGGVTPTPGPTPWGGATPLGGVTPTPGFVPPPGWGPTAVLGNTTPTWGGATPLGVTPMRAQRFADDEVIYTPGAGTKWEVRKSVYDKIQWKNDSGDVNLRKIAHKAAIHDLNMRDNGFEFNIKKLLPRGKHETHLHVENNLISKPNYRNELRQFTITDSWVRFPEMAIRYFNYNYEKPKSKEKEMCEDGDESCIICGESCSSDDISSCCGKVRTCLDCIGSMNEYSCSSCRGTLITPSMGPSHIMKIDANIRKAKLMKDNFASIINTASVRHLDNYPEHELFLIKEGSAATFYDMFAQALRKYEYNEDLNDKDLNAYLYVDNIPDIDDIGIKAYEGAKKAYLDLQYGFISNSLSKIWAQTNQVDLMQDKYQDAIMNLETRLRNSGIIEDLFQSGQYTEIEDLSRDDTMAILFIQTYRYILSDFDDVFGSE